MLHITNKEFKLPIMKKSSELQETSERQFNKLRNKIYEAKEYLTKEIEILNENQTEILELKYSTNNKMNALESIRNRADQMEEKIGELKNRNLDITQVEEERELRFLKSEKKPLQVL